MGLWIQQVHHALVGKGWVHPTDHDERKFGVAMVLVRRVVLVEGEDVPTMVEEQQGASDVSLGAFQ